MMQYEQERAVAEEDAMVAAALREAGVDVRGVYDLVNSKERYRGAIPILIDMLSRVRSDRIKEGVARALTVREARRVAAEPLIREFLAVPAETKSQQHTKWAIGNAIGAVADDSVFEEVLEVLADKRHGWTRTAAVAALGNMKGNRERAICSLLGFLDDEELGPDAMIVIGNLRVKEARSQVERFTQHPDSWVRQQAKRALAKIDKAK